MTHSGTCLIFSSVCLVVLSLTLLDGEKIQMGGFILNKLKKLNGLKFTFPSKSMVDAKHMGLGAIAYCKYFCISCGLSLSVSNVTMKKYLFNYFFKDRMDQSVASA
jgi:hypothetical protein